MAGKKYDALKEQQRALVRKMVQGSVFVAPSSADAIEKLTDADDSLLAPLPDGYVDLGLLTDDGAQFAREVDSSDITSWGATEPSRSDVTSDVTTLQVMCQETKLVTLSMYIGVDLDAFEPDESGEVKVSKPAAGDQRYFRALAVGVDRNDDGEIYIARYLPRCKVDAYEDQNMQSSDDEAFGYGFTLKGFTDDEVGASEQWIFGGPGWNALLEKMGFEVPSP